ncbi:hydroxyectoine utilization dehydratase EutB [Pseudovibrio exalbescens]|uniref:Hydroxyectoine utilization dehydratase EutB n=1 Tax=Pseudovibrio exalbescens TaxID=197461 RepID=A0A1U7JLP2_9HYPH|nr:hydroxyectoine utilization dehydratase EutB [Pseudovibrio exalbescens]OKL45660.1 hydroxyectoine utilization dehydratase EutB [Pseudovibrio exalbescens]
MNQSRQSEPDFTQVLQAQHRISAHIAQTPTVLDPILSRKLGCTVSMKFEHRQTTGSFKLRGATNAVLSLSNEEKRRGVIGVSTGNHGRALAYAAAQAGVSCIVCMSKLVPENKVQAIRDLGADVRIIGNSQDEAQSEVDRLIEQEGRTMIPPFDHPQVISGQGTLGLDIMAQDPTPECLLVPLSGGGLLAGIAVAVKTLRPQTRIIGISMQRGAAMAASLQAGSPVQVREEASLADSLGGGVGLTNRYTFNLVKRYVDQVILLSEEEIASGIRYAYWQLGEILEGSGAVGISALLNGKVKQAGPVAVVCSGRNIDLHVHHKLISGEMVNL